MQKDTEYQTLTYTYSDRESWWNRNGRVIVGTFTIIGILAFVSVLLTNSSESNWEPLGLTLTEDGQPDWPELVCGDEGHYTLHPKLLDEVETKCGDAEERGICQFTCNFPIVKLFNSEGYTTMKIFKEYNKAIVPPEYQKMAHKIWKKCFHEYGHGISEEKVGCDNAVKFDNCTMEAFNYMTCTKN